MGHCSTGSNKIQPDILLVIQKLECVLKMWLRSPTNDLLSFFLSFFPLLFISNQAGICGTRFPRAQVDISARHLCLMTPTCIQGHSQQKMFFSIHNTVKKIFYRINTQVLHSPKSITKTLSKCKFFLCGGAWWAKNRTKTVSHDYWSRS